MEDEIIANICSICSICRNEPTNAVKLDCGHTFCYLCIKSAGETTGVCALCRRELPAEFNFKKMNVLGPIRVPTSKDGFYWFYKGYQGWWLYDADTNRELEEAHGNGLSLINKLIAGHMYKLDLQSMTQQRQDGDGNPRTMMRSKLSAVPNCLGIGGLRGDEIDEAVIIMRSAD